eukprot:1158801-Pelagomonas_calceolata.AAC.6
MVRSESNYTQQLCDTCAQEFVEDFSAWYSMEHGGSDTNGMPVAHRVEGEQDTATSVQTRRRVQALHMGGPMGASQCGKRAWVVMVIASMLDEVS